MRNSDLALTGCGDAVLLFAMQRFALYIFVTVP